jgi:hypothetical protein
MSGEILKEIALRDFLHLGLKPPDNLSLRRAKPLLRR